MPVSAPRRLLAALTVALFLAACGADVASPTLEDGGLRAEATAVEEVAASPTDGPTESARQDVDGSEQASDGPSDAPTDTDPVDGGDDEGQGGDATAEVADAAPSCTLTDQDAGIQVLTPADGASVDETFTISGCGNTFEATYLYEVVLDDGTVVADGFGTMTCGSGCVGSFDTEVTATASGAATVVVFEEDARDGGRANVVEVPVTIVP